MPALASSEIDSLPDMDKWNEDQVCCFLRSTGINNEEVESLVYSQKIDGEVLRVLTMQHVEKVFGEHLVFGQVIKLLKRRDEACALVDSPEPGKDMPKQVVPVRVPTALHKDTGNKLGISSGMPEKETESGASYSFDSGGGADNMLGSRLGEADMENTCDSCYHHYSEVLRPFDKEPSETCKYMKGAIVSCNLNQHDDMIRPVHQFSILNLAQKDGVHSMVKETVKFICACLNVRTNGTIHFGISPEKNNIAHQGEIQGTFLKREKTAYCSFVARAVEECFFLDQRDLVRACVRSPRFIEVLQEKGSSEPREYVMEIDVIPASSLCGDDTFYLKLPAEKIKDKLIYDKARVYLFLDGSIQAVEGERLYHFMSTTMKLFTLRREREGIRKAPRLDQNLARKLTYLLCQDEEKLIGDNYPILVLSKPAAHMTNEYLSKNFTFLECVPWKAVFDFDNETRMCSFMEKDRGQLLKIIGNCEEFNSKSPNNQKSPDRLRSLQDDIRSSIHLPWILANGYNRLPIEHGIALDPFSWKKNKKEGFNEAVRYFGNEIPTGRALVVFCVLSKYWEVMLEGAEEFFTVFPDQWMCIAEDEIIMKPWMEELVRRNCVDPKSLNDNVVCGMPWSHVNETICQITKPRPLNKCYLPCSDGSFCGLERIDQNSLPDLEILSGFECENSGTENYCSEHSRVTEDHFYKGNEVEWWNFWYKTHVCERSQHQQLISFGDKALKSSTRDDEQYVRRVFLYHQPGAGGTTMAKKVLWDHRKTYRCAIVRNLSDQTSEQITQLRSHGDMDNPNPVLLLFDNQDEEKTNVLLAELHEQAKRITRHDDTEKAVCVVLVCLRRSSLRTQCEGRRDPERSIMLKQKLSSQDLFWFQDKAKQLEYNFAENHKGKDPMLLISFNILKENFSEEYIERTVKSLVKDIHTDKEKELLKCVAFLNAYDLHFRSVPTAAFDHMMFPMAFDTSKRGHTLCYGLTYGNNKLQRRWENRLCPSFHVLTNDILKTALGYIHSLRITNPLLSRWILDVLRSEAGETVGDVALSFLENAEIFKVPTGMAGKELLKIVSDVLKNRRRHPSGRPDGDFPPLVEDLLKESREKVEHVLIQGYELTADPFVAQQIARVFMHFQMWDEALHYAKLATDKKNDNSYLLDTYGRVFQRQLTDRHNQLKKDVSTLSVEDARIITEQALKGIDVFHEVQKLSEEECQIAGNDAGYFGELDIVISFLECLSCLQIFRAYPSQLHTFLVDEQFIPADLHSFCDVDGRNLNEQIKQLHQGVKKALNHLDDERVQLKDEMLDDYRWSNYRWANQNLGRIKEKLGSYFGEEYDEVPLGLTMEEQCHYRQRRIFQLSGDTLGSIFNLHKTPKQGEPTLCKVRDFALQNIESGHAASSDYQTMIAVCFALKPLRKTLPYEINFADMIRWSKQLYEVRETLGYVSLEPYLFYTMLNWPRTRDAAGGQVNPSAVSDALKNWKEAYYHKYPRQREGGKPFRKKDTTMFFLANGTGIESVVSDAEIQSELGADGKEIKGIGFWSVPSVLRKLKRFKGLLCHDGREVQIDFDYGRYTASVIIPTSIPMWERAWWSKDVYFVIGFSWFGPKAFDVKLKDPTANVDYMTISHSVPSVIGKTKGQFQSQVPPRLISSRLKKIDTYLREIETLKSQFGIGRAKRDEVSPSCIFFFFTGMRLNENVNVRFNV